jgi:hypothetical protein
VCMRFTCNSIAIRLSHAINDTPLQITTFNGLSLYKIKSVKSIKRFIETLKRANTNCVADGLHKVIKLIMDLRVSLISAISRTSLSRRSKRGHNRADLYVECSIMLL